MALLSCSSSSELGCGVGPRERQQAKCRAILDQAALWLLSLTFHDGPVVPWQPAAPSLPLKRHWGAKPETPEKAAPNQSSRPGAEV